MNVTTISAMTISTTIRIKTTATRNNFIDFKFNTYFEKQSIFAGFGCIYSLTELSCKFCVWIFCMNFMHNCSMNLLKIIITKVNSSIIKIFRRFNEPLFYQRIKNF